MRTIESDINQRLVIEVKVWYVVRLNYDLGFSWELIDVGKERFWTRLAVSVGGFTALGYRG